MRAKKLIAGIGAMALMVVGAGIAQAGDLLVSAELLGGGAVSLEEGETKDITLEFSAEGAVACTATSTNPILVSVSSTYTLGPTGLAASGDTTVLQFWGGAQKGTGNNCDVTWTGAPTPYTVNATLTAVEGASSGTQSLAVGLTITNPSGVDGKLAVSTKDGAADLDATVTEPDEGGGDPLPDTTPPTIDCGSADGEWHADDVEITCTASDASGLADEDQASFTLSTDVAAGTETNDASTNSVSVCDTEGNCADAGPISGNKVDKKAPSITVTAPSGSYLLNQTVLAAYSCSDGGSDIDTCAGEDDLGPVANGDAVYTGTVGGKGFSVSATDNVGNTATWPEAAATTAHQYTVSYAPAGTSCLGSPGHQILQPINNNGSSVFKLGSTVPAKFRVCDANGDSVGSQGVVKSFALTKKVAGLESTTVNEPVLATTPDTAFRWSADGQQWIYNINTRNLTGGTTYTYTITLNDDSTIEFTFGIKK